MNSKTSSRERNLVFFHLNTEQGSIKAKIEPLLHKHPEVKSSPSGNCAKITVVPVEMLRAEFFC